MTPRRWKFVGAGAAVLVLAILIGLFVWPGWARGQSAPATTEPTPVVVVQTQVVEVPGPVQTVIVEITSTPGAPAPTSTPIPPSVVVSGFPMTPREVVAMFKLRGENGLEVREGDIQPCPDGKGGVEASCWEIKISPFYITNPWGVWLEGFRHYAGTPRPGGYNRPERSGIPPYAEDELVDSGITIRPESYYAAAPTPGPFNWDSRIEVTISGFPETARQAATMYGINVSVTFPYACGEGHCFIIRPLEPGKNFVVTNPTACWMDGYRIAAGQVRPGFEKEVDAGKISIPPYYSGQVEEILIRPCEQVTPTPTP